jgi:hypothetical protein
LNITQSDSKSKEKGIESDEEEKIYEESSNKVHLSYGDYTVLAAMAKLFQCSIKHLNTKMCG